MHSRLLILCLMFAVLAPAAGAPQPAAKAVLTLADPPLRLIRGATVFRAGSGVALLQDDILETASGGAQFEAGPDAIVALGPQTRVLVSNFAPLELNLLQGWLKVSAKGRRALVTTPALQVALASGTTIAATDAVFAEEGEQQAARLDAQGRAGPALRLAVEQYAGVDAAKPQPVPGRPPRAFVTAMPAAFHDRLVPAPRMANAGKVVPVRERDADFADVAPWLQSGLPGRRGFVARFRPRLLDAEFRRQLERTLGQSAEWKPVLRPTRPSTSNALF